MNCRLGSTFSGNDDVSLSRLADAQIGDIVLMATPVSLVLLLLLRLFETSEESLFVGGDILDDSKSCRHVEDLIVALSKVEARLVSISRESVNMVDLVSHLWLLRETLSAEVWRWNLIDLSQEMLESIVFVGSTVSFCMF